MVLEVGEFGEPAVAHLTLVGPAAVMHLHVGLEVARGGERLGAQGALVRLLLEGTKYVVMVQ